MLVRVLGDMKEGTVAKRVNSALSLILFTLCSTAARAQPVVYQVADINPGPAGSLPLYDTSFVVAGSALYFPADDGTHGIGLWKSDGTAAGTVMVFNGGPGNVPGGEAAIGSTLYFRAGSGLWKTDGGPAVLLHDFGPNGEASSSNWANLGGTLLFAATQDYTQPYSGNELWRSDGTPAGTFQVADINPGPAGSLPLYDTSFVVAGSALYFPADDGTHGIELWKSDGTAAGTVMVQPPGSSVGGGEAAIGSTLYFRAGSGLWKTDGGPPVLVYDFGPNGEASSSNWANLGGTLLFAATQDYTQPYSGNELWAVLKSASGTVGPGGTLGTAPGGSEPDPSDPVDVAVTTPSGGTIQIVQQATAEETPAGFVAGGHTFSIAAPDETTAAPLVLQFVIDASLVPPGGDATSIAVFRDGAEVSACDASAIPTGAASPDPCVADRQLLLSGDVTVTVRSSHASTWSLFPAACPPTPRAGCVPAASGKSKLTVKQGATSSKDSLTWSWKSAATVMSSDLGDPLSQTGFAICLYDAGGRRSATALSAGGSCLGKPCWKATGGGFKYSNADVTSPTTLLLKPGLAGKARIGAKGRGQALGLPSLPLAVPVTMDLVSNSGRCWSARYATALASTDEQFKAKSQ
jgi:ELWxxDGT repeat protein